MRKAVLHLSQSDPVMRAIIERVGPCRMEYGDPEFHSLAEAIIYQQLNGKAAVTIFKRFAALAGEPLTPEGILKLSEEQLRSVGLSKQKSSYLRDLASKTHEGKLDFGRLPKLSDDEVIEHLTQVKGIGVWTAHMFLMFALRRPNVLPSGRFRRAYGDEEVLQETQPTQAGSDGKDRESVGALSLGGVLVFVEESRRENDVRHR